MNSQLKFIKAKDVSSLISNGACVGVGGFIGIGVAEEIHIEIEKNFIANGLPRDLTLIYAGGVGDGISKGLNHYAHEGLIKRVIGGHWGLVPKLQPLVVSEAIEAYNFPQGVIAQFLRDSAAGKPRTISKVGIGTFVDPDIDGGKLNKITKEDLVEKIKFYNEEYLAYKTQKVDVAIIKGTEVDEKGNVGFSKEPLSLESLSLAMNAKNNGGIVIVQVEKIVKSGALSPRDVKVPHILVDYVVVAENQENHMQTFGTQFNELFVRNDIKVKESEYKYPLNERKVIARRAAMLLDSSKNVLNFGIGVPEVIAEILREEKQEHLFTPTIEPGAIGGTPLGGLDFGAAINPDAIIDQPIHSAVTADIQKIKSQYSDRLKTITTNDVYNIDFIKDISLQNEQTIIESNYTRLVDFLRATKDFSSDPNIQEDNPEQSKTDIKAINQQFDNILTYHQQRAAELLKALSL